MIKDNVAALFAELPKNVQLVAATKTRTPEEVKEAVSAGIKIVGENYIQEAERNYRVVGKSAQWHFIGHLQRNKTKKACQMFDMIETVDSVQIAAEIDKRCSEGGKVMPILIEVNSGREKQKSGVMPDDTEKLVREIAPLKNAKVLGLMTMGPELHNAEDLRPYFSETKKLFDRIKTLRIPNVEMKYLSMGMTNSYRVAIEEGANIVRIGSKIFGERRQ
jgi:pyridoxal phosphate enzyme (YggS family)